VNTRLLATCFFFNTKSPIMTIQEITCGLILARQELAFARADPACTHHDILLRQALVREWREMLKQNEKGGEKLLYR
jgi:hypothetical protein